MRKYKMPSVRKSQCLFGMLFLIVAISYTPYIVNGGFGSGDDLGYVSQTMGGFDVKEFLSVQITSSQSSRPLAILALATALFFYGGVPAYYLLTQLSIWAGTTWALAVSMRDMFGKWEAWIFALLMFFPFFCSGSLLSSVCGLSGYGLSIFFWSLSVLFLTKNAITGRDGYRLWAYAALLLGILSLELILPLLIFTALLPAAFRLSRSRLADTRELAGLHLKSILPVLCIAVLFLFFKLYVTKLYQTTYDAVYGLAPLSLKSFAQAAYFFIALAGEVPIMLLEAFPHLFRIQPLCVAAGICAFVLVLKTNGDAEAAGREPAMPQVFVRLILASLAACSSSFFLSAYPAVTYGFYNRLMLPSFVLVCMLVSIFVAKAMRRGRVVPVILFASVWAASMLAQLSGNIESWRLRNEVLSDCVARLKEGGVGPGSVLVANVPYFVEDNYNNVEVFYLSWAIEAGLKVFGFDKKIRAIPVCWRSVVDSDFNSAHNINTIYKTIGDDSVLYYYEFDHKTRKSTLEKLAQKRDLLDKLARIKEEKINYYPPILREKMRNKFRSILVGTPIPQLTQGPIAELPPSRIRVWPFGQSRWF